MEQNFHYYAFISYSTADSKWAKWLQHKLSYYHIPSSIKKSKIGIPSKIRPIFIYEYDLTGNQLHKAIQQELEASKYLIVICSPKAAESIYVNREVETFIKMGRSEYIIPFIVDGEVDSSDPSKECFPPALLDLLHSGDKNNELRGINAMKSGKHQAIVDTVATMLGVRRDVLWNRYKMRQLKQRILMLAIATVALFCGLFYWEYTRPAYKYFADYVDKWGIPNGIIELEESVYKHRYRSYRFEYRRIPLGENNALSWRLSKVEYVNSAGQPQDYQDGEIYNRYAITQLEYNSSGTIKHIDLFNKAGKLILRWKVSSKEGIKAALIDFLGTTDIDASGYLGVSTTKSLEISDINTIHKSSIKRYVIDRDSLGYILSISYHSNNDDNIEFSKTTDVNGIHKQYFINDSLGRVLVTKYFDIHNKIINSENGIAIRKNVYDSWGNSSEIEYLNSDMMPVLCDQLYSKTITKSDEWGNVVKSEYYGVDGSLCFNKYNVSQEIIELDNRGFPKTVSFFDTNLLPCRHSEGFSKLIIDCDSRGNQTRTQFKDITGKFCLNKDGIAKIFTEYDRRGNLVYVANFDINDNLVLNKYGFAVVNYKYRNGNRIEENYFDENWNACSNSMGFATQKIEYEDRGYPQRYTFFNVKGEKTLCKNGFSSFTYHFNDRGNPDEISYYNIDDIPCVNIWDFHKQRFEYDSQGNLTEFCYYNTTGQLCESKELFSVCKRFPDSLGNIRRWIYYDTLRRPTKDVYGICDYRFQFDHSGRITKVRYFDEIGAPSTAKNCTAGWDAKYDNRGNQIEYVNIDINGNICCDSLGVAKIIKEFDQRGNQLSYSQYDENNRAISAPNGIASWKNEYNDRGLLLTITYFDEKGNPCVNKDLGYSRYETKYNENMDQTEVCTYDEKGLLCVDPRTGFAHWIAKYDDDNNKIEMISFSEKDSLCVCNFGYARWVAKYNKDGLLKEICSYDESGKLLIHQTETNEKTEQLDIRKYDSHRFKYELVDIVFGFLFLIILIVILWYWIKNILAVSFQKNLLVLAGVLSIVGLDYLFLEKFLLHYTLIPYGIYNYSWVLCLISSLCCLSVVLFLLHLFVSCMVQILKVPKYRRKSAINEKKGELIFFLIFIGYLSSLVYVILEQGWNIYSNPL